MAALPFPPESIEALFVRGGIVAPEPLARARLASEESGEPLDAVVTRLGLASERAIAEACAQALDAPLLTAADFPAEPIVIDTLTTRFLQAQRLVPTAMSDDEAVVAFANPLDRFALEAARFALDRPIAVRVATASDIEAAIERLYGSTHAAGAAENETVDEADLERLKDLASDAPVIRLVNRLIARAVDMRASDIHIEPNEDGVAIRFRVDGVMREQEPLGPAMRAPLVSRIKVMADLNIAEKRLPQDGRLRIAVRGQDIDLRVASSPTIHGETMVLRLLDRSGLVLELATLGFDTATAEAVTRATHQPHGIVLVTGPTGSGKTTTLYAALATLNRPERKILTIEDPIEYRMAGISQTQVQPAIGLTFAAALRSFLRQDPDVMMVGEIRDLETAQIAVQAALTGHMILATLHTNTAAAAITRLADMGVEPFLISSTLTAVLAQRLARRLCPSCREPYVPTAEQLAPVGFAQEAGVTLYRATGCPACGGSGYRGRVALVEFLPVTDAVGRLITERASLREIEEAGRAAGMRSMIEDGFAKACAGLTTIEELLRILREV